MGILSQIFGHSNRFKKPLEKSTEPVSIQQQWNTEGPIKITRDNGKVNPIGMSYWRNINQHKDNGLLEVILSINDILTVFIIQKSNLQVISERSLQVTHTGEGVFYSAHDPKIIYIPYDNRIEWFNTGSLEHDSIITAPPAIKMWQAHCNYSEKVWSFTCKNSNYDITGWGVFNGKDQFMRFELKGTPDECQIDKSGMWLLIKEDNYNRIIWLPTGVERIIQNEQGALGHSDNGWECAYGENDFSQYGGALDRIRFVDGSHQDVYHTNIWDMGYVSYTNCKSPNYVKDICLLTTPKELIAVDLVTNEGKVICPNMTEDWDTYENKPKANLCPEGEFAVWTALVGGRLDAYIVRVPRW